MVVVDVGAVCVYFDPIEANVLCQLLDASIMVSGLLRGPLDIGLSCCLVYMYVR